MMDKQTLLSQMLTAFNEGDAQNNNQNRLKTTSVPGYPVFLSWGFLSAIEFDDKGGKKAIFLCPFLSVPALSLVVQPPTNPGSIVETNMIRPQNLKLKIPDHINSSQLKEELFYTFLAAVKPAAMGGNRGGSPISYWDGYLCFASLQVNGLIEDFLNQFKAARVSNPVSPTVPAAPPSVPKS